jgi:hypothetical protein
MDGKIEWLQVFIAFIAGVLLSATAKGLVSQLRGQAAGAVG